jgi:transcriptional regulator with GAF, ATPase, and Fis domain
MLAETMAAPRTPPRPETPEGRRKSKLTQAGEAAQRELLLQTLKTHGWNLTHTAETLEMAGPADVLRSMKVLGLSEEYEAAKERGEAKPGRPKVSE